MAETKKFCIHSDGLGYCDILSGESHPQYCVEGPCPREELVEYEPVKHGRWIDRPGTKGQVYCSECRTLETSTDSNYKSRRCPNCGADMKVDG